MKHADGIRLEWGIDVKIIEAALGDRERTVKEIARHTGLPVNRVRNILSKALNEDGDPYFDYEYDRHDARIKLWKLWRMP